MTLKTAEQINAQQVGHYSFKPFKKLRVRTHKTRKYK